MHKQTKIKKNMCKYFWLTGQIYNQEVFGHIELPPVSDDGDLADPQDPTDPLIFLSKKEDLSHS